MTTHAATREVYLLRHGQTTFNVLYEGRWEDPMLFDAQLTELGHAQAAAAAQAVKALGIDLMVTSPLTRALQTAAHVSHACGVRSVVHPLHRERQFNSCDIGVPASVLRRRYPRADFSLLPEVWWSDQRRDRRGIAVESDAGLAARVADFRRWVREQDARSMLIVGHGTFFEHLSTVSMGNGELLRWEP